jgi:5,10-methylenetetrahydromethanopterin reductase
MGNGSMLEIWRAGGSTTGFSRSEAGAVEAEGWDGQMFMDSQSLSADPYVQMGAWAGATSRLLLSTGVTNPLTRNLAVTAAGAATVQVISGGRAVLGIGRGDSALAYLGLAPAPLAGFEQALVTLQALLSGQEVDFTATGERGRSRGVESLSLGARPQAAQLKWLPPGLAKVPLDVAATGPKVIAMAARIAERVTFSVGAEIERLAWALELARAARAAAGLGDAGVSYGAQLVVVCHADAETALEQAMIMAPPLARFQVLEGAAAGPGGDDASLGAVRAGYDMNKHGGTLEKNKLTHGALSPDFVRRFAIAGTPEQCTRRLLELRRAGLERFVIVGPGFYPEAWGEARGLFAREVIPALRAQG